MWPIAIPSPLLAFVDDPNHGVRGLFAAGARLRRVAFEGLGGVLLVCDGHRPALVRGESALRAAVTVLFEAPQSAIYGSHVPPFERSVAGARTRLAVRGGRRHRLEYLRHAALPSSLVSASST